MNFEFKDITFFITPERLHKFGLICNKQHAWSKKGTLQDKKGHTSDKMSPIITVVIHACLVCDIQYTFVMWDSHICWLQQIELHSISAQLHQNWRNLEQCCLHENTLTFFFLGVSVSLDWESIQNIWKSVGTKHSFERWILLTPTKMWIVYCVEVMLEMMTIHGSHYCYYGWNTQR